MRILSIGNMYPPHHQGGYELMWRAGTHRLRQEGHEVRVLTSDHREVEPEVGLAEDPDVHRELRWYWRDHAFPRLGIRERVAIERHSLSILDRHLNGFQPDVVAWWPMGGMSMSLIERVRRLDFPAVGFVHDEWLLYGRRTDLWHRLANRRGIPTAVVDRLSGIPSRVDFTAAAEWAFVSEAMRRKTMRDLALKRTVILSSGIDRSLFRPAPAHEWGWQLLCVGRIDPRKGVELAIRGLLHLPQASLRILGVGDQDYRRRLDALVEDLDLRDRVTLTTSPRDALPSEYAAADALLFPVQWEEPWGLVPLEAMACGTPVIATGTGGSAEYLRDGENCLLFEPKDDARALAVQVTRLARDPGLRQRLRETGFETAERHDESNFLEGVAEVHRRAGRAGEADRYSPRRRST